ncbi:response regulator transcription factor [Vibrio sp. Of7-15]|uniref:response regulator transcription factor n=1 Tax=Vibrio sp. Of7-15 TaxID=2724879 RepID=UPI001EF2BE91|nr:response regulator transcription factor [Vibrio sp. Of7-15]
MLLVEDDIDLSELIIEFLESESIECDLAYHGEMALELVQQTQFDVIITDVMMPKMDGHAFCTELRNLGITTPCLMLTAQSALEDKLTGFDKGADDYMVKPFELLELKARILALARRHSNDTHLLKVSNLVLNTKTHQASLGNDPLNLGPIEWKILEYLMRNSPNVVSREKLETMIWPDEPPSSDALKMQLYRLRKIINKNEVLLHTVRGMGIALRAED